MLLSILQAYVVPHFGIIKSALTSGGKLKSALKFIKETTIILSAIFYSSQTDLAFFFSFLMCSFQKAFY